MKIINDIKLDFDDVLLIPKRSNLRSRKDVDLTRTFYFPSSDNTWTGIPIIASNMDTVGTYKVAEVLNKNSFLTALHKFYSLDDYIANYNNTNMIPSIGPGEFEKFNEIYDKLELKPMFLCVDVANGYGEYLLDFVKEIKYKYPHITLICGNVVTREMTEQLITCGVDIVKIGIGSGAACTTRIKTGVGCPQLSAILECADVAHGHNRFIISDGGCKTPGDVSKAFAAGADFVMLGGMFAGHEETPGDIIYENYKSGKVDYDRTTGALFDIIETKKFKMFYGMSSQKAQEKYYGEKFDYRASEGRCVKIPYKGKIQETINEILGGIRSTCTYVGASKIKYLPKCATFIRVNKVYNNIYEKFDI